MVLFFVFCLLLQFFVTALTMETFILKFEEKEPQNLENVYGAIKIILQFHTCP